MAGAQSVSRGVGASCGYKQLYFVSGFKIFSGPKYRRLIFSEGVSAAITFEFAI